MTSIKGIVIKGKQEGTKMGFPTANIEFGVSIRHEAGIYSGYAFVDGQKFKSAIYISEDRPDILEAHIMDLEGNDLYGKEIEVKIIEKIRDQIKGLSVDKLKKVIQDDVQMIKLSLDF